MLPSMCSNMITLMHPHIWRKMKEEWERIVFSDYSSRIIMCFQKLLSVFFLVCEQLCHTNQEHHKVTDAEHSKLTHEVRNKSTGKLLDIKDTVKTFGPTYFEQCSSTPLLGVYKHSSDPQSIQQAPQYYNKHVSEGRNTAPNSPSTWG